MIVTLNQNDCVIQLGPKERIKHESDFYYTLRDALRSLGHDVVKKIPEQDGHMTHAPWYIRSRDYQWCVLDRDYAIRCPAKALNFRRELVLNRIWLET